MKYRIPQRPMRRARIGGPRDPRISIPGATLNTAWTLVPGAAAGTVVPQNPEDAPFGWTLAMEDTFDGPTLDGSKWLNRTFSGGAHCAGDQGCSAAWDGGAGISVSGGNLRLRVARNGASWLVTGLQQGGGSQYNFHPGYGEFHVRFRARFSHFHAPGIGWYGLMWPWHNIWSTELDITENPGKDKNRSDATVHWDNEINNFQAGGSFIGPNLSQFCVYDCRRTYSLLNGRKVAKIEIWLNGQKLAQSDGTPYDEVNQNIYEVEPMVLGFASYVRCPTYCIDWFSDIDGTTPNEAYAEIDYVRIWEPKPPVASALVDRVDILLRGADSAAALISAGGAAEIQRVVKALTGIATVNIIASNTGNRTTHLSSVTADVAGTAAVEWLTGDPVTAPVQWIAQAPLTQTLAALSAGMSPNPAHPLLDVALHWEADLQQTGANAGAYATGRGEVSRRIAAAAGKALGKYAVFDGYAPYTTSVQSAAVSAINAAWANGVYQAGSEQLAAGQFFDVAASGAVWNSAGAMQAATRIGIRLARYCFEKGWTANDLGGLPALGMNVGGMRREASASDLTIFVQHDRASDIVIPLGVNPAAFEVTDGTTTRVGTALKYRTTQSFTVTFNGPIPTSPNTVLRHCWNPAFFGPGTLVSDNYHTSDVFKPGVIGSTSGAGTMTMPLQRTILSVPLDAGGTDPGPGPGPSTRSPVFGNNIAAAPLNAVTNVTVTGLIPGENFEWTVRTGAPNYKWRTDPGEPYKATADSNGQAVLPALFIATNDAVKLLFDSRSVSVDSPPVQTVPANPQPSGDAAFAAEWHRTLTNGINFERFRPLSFAYNGQPYRSSTAGWNYIKSAGVTHVRGFYAWDARIDFGGDGVIMGNGVRPSIQKIRDFLDPWVQCCRAGLKCWIDFTDVAALDVVQEQRGIVNSYMVDMCNEIKARPELSPDIFMVGAFNELVLWDNQGTNTHWNPVRMETHALIRNILPNHIIAHGAANWCSPNFLTAPEWQAPPDKRSMGSAHTYEDATRGRGFWGGIQADFDDFTSRNGIPVIFGEVGDLYQFAVGQDPGFRARWMQMMTDLSIAAPRTKAVLWALTNPENRYAIVGNPGNDNFYPDIEQTFRSIAGNWQQ